MERKYAILPICDIKTNELKMFNYLLNFFIKCKQTYFFFAFLVSYV